MGSSVLEASALALNPLQAGRPSILSSSQVVTEGRRGHSAGAASHSTAGSLALLPWKFGCR